MFIRVFRTHIKKSLFNYNTNLFNYIVVADIILISKTCQTYQSLNTSIIENKSLEIVFFFYSNGAKKYPHNTIYFNHIGVIG